ncbi:MAG: thioredoxin [bacterium]|jgi:thioredoxin 1
MANVHVITDSNFESEVLKSTTPVLVDFWATWCGPCKALGPKLEELSGSYTGKVKFVKVDVDQNPETASRFGIRGIPTLILFKNGQMVDQLVGNQPKEVIENIITKHS